MILDLLNFIVFVALLAAGIVSLLVRRWRDLSARARQAEDELAQVRREREWAK